MDTRAPIRQIKKVWKNIPTIEGAGVRLKRVFGFHEVPQLDPFLLLDCFQSDNRDDYVRGFPWHPHRGMETITYVLDGDVEHQDSLGNRGIIRPGDVQWMTAGSGIIHQEMPKGNAKGRMWGFQLWANLPSRQKMMDPRYREVTHDQIPAVKTADGATVRIICGQLGGVQGPVREIVTDPEYLDISLPAGKTFAHPVKPGYTVFAYVVEGEGYFDAGRNPFGREAIGENYFDMKPSCACPEGTIALYESAGDTVLVAADKKPVRFLLVSGKPLKELVAWYGPIVMNTQQELQTAFKEFQAGTFIKQGEASGKK
ncbi:MAG: pirin family protein [Candidatus Omnitrophica bacterium]|nr:pirin family protein [Candidatus Omnitrophota bacterium]